MQQLELLNQPAFYLPLAGIVGLMVGSFLNVVIYRLPIMMQRGWRKDCVDYLSLDASAYLNPADGERFNLLLPPSRCPLCQAPIKPHHNIPVLGYLFLRGRCAACDAAIPWRYPAIEALTGLLSVLVAWQFGFSGHTLLGLLLTWSLIALSFIDIDHQLLPDSITLPLTWLGLLLSLSHWFTDAHASIIGAAAGYLFLWSVYHIFKLTTGKEGMGYGDFKLLAMLGAWLGWQYLPQIVLLSTLAGALLGVAMIVVGNQERSKPIPFGPYLALAGWIALLWGQRINQLYFGFSGWQ